MEHQQGDHEHSARSGSSGPPIKLILLLLVALALAIFIFQNGQDAAVDFLWLDGDWPAWIVISISVLAGIVIDRLATWQWRRTRKRKEATEA
jgi:uncharacterized integral membrane protein